MKNKVMKFLEKEIELEHIPGAVIYVSHEGKEILKESIGFSNEIKGKKIDMSNDTLFDLASLTKVIATLPLIMNLIDEGVISLNDKVADFIPEFAESNKKALSIFNLLTHTSGLISHRSYFETMKNRKEILASIYKEKLHYTPGEKVIYSDLGFILLQEIIESVTKKPIEVLLKEKILNPLSMKNTSFNPTAEFSRYAATEYSPSISTRKVGSVHDDNTEIMGGISGHAGLFSTIDDVVKFSKMVENNGIFNNKRIISDVAMDLTKKNHTSLLNLNRGLGWSIKGEGFDSCGDYFSRDSYGHTGFTGTSIWFDPEINLKVILLTNRVYYGRNLDFIKSRPKLHNIIRSHY